MADNRREILRLLMQKQMPNMIGAQPGGVAGSARLAPGEIGGPTRFLPSASSEANRNQGFAAPSGPVGPQATDGADEKTGEVEEARGLTTAPVPGTGAEYGSTVPTTPKAIYGPGDKQQESIGARPINPDAITSEALLYAQSTPDYVPLTYEDNIPDRDLPLSDDLRTDIQKAVYNVYGPEYSVVVHSGGQPPWGTRGLGHNRVGSTRHDRGDGADIYVVGPDGKRVQGTNLARLGQYWLAKGLGSTGLEMAGGAIHLDHTTREELEPWERRSWNYLSKGGVYTPEMDKRIKAGIAGRLPNIYQRDVLPIPNLSASDLGITDPQFDPLHTRFHGNFGESDPNAVLERATNYAKAPPSDPYAKFFPPVPRRRPAR